MKATAVIDKSGNYRCMTLEAERPSDVVVLSLLARADTAAGCFEIAELYQRRAERLRADEEKARRQTEGN